MLFPSSYIHVVIPDLYESDIMIRETVEFYKHKVIKWIHNKDFDDVIDKYVSINIYCNLSK